MSAVALLLVGCSTPQTTPPAGDAAVDADDRQQDEELAATDDQVDLPAVTPDQPGPGVFTFAEDDLCDWVSEEDVAAFVRQTYARQGVEWDGEAPAVTPPWGSAWDDQAWDVDDSYCRWEPTGGGHVVARRLPWDAVSRGGAPEPFPPGYDEDGAGGWDPGLAANIVVSNHAFGRYAFWVEGSEEVLGLEVRLPGLPFEDQEHWSQVRALLDVANGFLVDMGWS